MAEVSTILVSKDYVDKNLNPIAVGANPYRVMLDNWYFGNPINQNGLAEYTGLVNKVSVDRWLLSDESLKVIVNDGFITLTNQSVTTGYFYQYFDSSFTILNLPLTVSCLTADGALYTGNKTFTNINTDNEYLVDISATLKFGIKYFSEVDKWAFVFHCHDVDDLASINILAVKAEYGDSQTLAIQGNDSKWTPITLPNYAEEYAKCIQYDKVTGEHIGMVPEAIGSVGRDVSGQTFTSDEEGISVVAGVGAELFNDYKYNIASGEYSHAEGQYARALGDTSHSEGCDTIALGESSHAEGYGSSAIGKYSHAEGYGLHSLVSNCTLSGDAGATTYKVSGWITTLGTVNTVIVCNDVCAYITASSQTYSTITLDKTLSSDTALVNASFFIARGSLAYGDSSHAEGRLTQAFKEAAHSEGRGTSAMGVGSHSEGISSKAKNDASHAEGYKTEACADYSHAEGEQTLTYGLASHAEGGLSIAFGDWSHAEGDRTIAYGEYSHAEGENSSSNTTLFLTGDANVTTYTVKTWYNDIRQGAVLRYGHSSFAKIVSCSNTSMTVTLDKTLSADAALSDSTVYIWGSFAYSQAAHSEGYRTTASGVGTHSEGSKTIAYGDYSHAEGDTTDARGKASHTEGTSTVAQGESSHSEGSSTVAYGNASHVEGYGAGVQFTITGDANATTYTVSIHNPFFKEGCIVTYNGVYAKVLTYDITNSVVTLDKTLSSTALSAAVCEYYAGIAYGEYSHAEGAGSVAVGIGSHAEGGSFAVGNWSHSEGSVTYAYGANSHTEGDYTIAHGDNQHVQGKYNVEDENGTYAHIVGNGTKSSKSNAHTLDWEGNAWYSGEIRSGGTSYEDANKLVTSNVVTNITTGTTDLTPGVSTLAAGTVYLVYEE